MIARIRHPRAAALVGTRRASPPCSPSTTTPRRACSARRTPAGCGERLTSTGMPSRSRNACFNTSPATAEPPIPQHTTEVRPARSGKPDVARPFAYASATWRRQGRHRAGACRTGSAARAAPASSRSITASPPPACPPHRSASPGCRRARVVGSRRSGRRSPVRPRGSRPRHDRSDADKDPQQFGVERHAASSFGASS